MKRMRFLVSLTCTLYLVLCTSPAFSQPKPEIKKTKSSAVIDGKKFYLHTVEKGQTLYAISRVYEVTVSELVTENPDAIDGIKPGQVLRIPYPDKKKKNGEEPDKGDYYYHKVEQGETVASVAKRFGVTEELILKNNPGMDKSGLKPGQLLKLPGAPKEVNPPVLQKDTLKKNGHELNSSNPPLINSNENNFSVALFLPFYLSNTPYIDAEKIKKGLADYPRDSRIAIEFYQGAMMALDSLKKSGVSVKLFVYDSGSDSSGTIDVSRIPELKKMNLIIGPLYTAHFVGLSKFARENNIPIISPLSQNNKILLGNVNVSKAMPSVMTQVEQVSAYIGRTWADQNLFIMNSPGPKENAYNNTVKQIVNASFKEHGRMDSILPVSTIKAITDNLRSDKVNVIVVMSANPTYITDILSKLNKMKEDTKGRDSIIVVGMQAWSGIESIDMEYLNNLNVYLPSNYWVAYDDPHVTNFIRQYRSNTGTEPSEYVYQGFDVLYFYVSALKAAGVKAMIQDLPNHKWKGVHLNFDLYQASPESGYENRSVFVLRYDHYQLVKAE